MVAILRIEFYAVDIRKDSKKCAMPKLFNEFFGVTSVCVELGLEVFEVFECAFLAQGGEEIDFYRVAVYVFGKVKKC